MMHHRPLCPAATISDPPRRIYRDIFHPQIVNVIHPVEIVNRHHCVPIPRHIVTCSVRDEFCNIPGYPGGPALGANKKS